MRYNGCLIFHPIICKLSQALWILAFSLLSHRGLALYLWLLYPLGRSIFYSSNPIMPVGGAKNIEWSATHIEKHAHFCIHVPTILVKDICYCFMICIHGRGFISMCGWGLVKFYMRHQIEPFCFLDLFCASNSSLV
jgi:hypothetical protein